MQCINKVKQQRIAIVYQILAHYREPVFKKLCEQNDEFEYTFFSDKVNSIDRVKVINPVKSTLPISNGGLRWRFVRNIRLFHLFIWQKGIINAAMSNEFDCMIFLGNMYFFSTWIACLILKFKKKKILMWSHGYLRKEKGLRGWLRKQFYQLADGMLLYGNRAREIMIKKGFDPDRLYVIYNSLDYDKQKELCERVNQAQLDELRHKLFNETELPIIMFIGRLTRIKKLDMILKAARLLDKNKMKVNILFIGDGDEKDNLIQLARELDLSDRTVFYGACYEEEELAPLIMLSDLCISPGEVGLTSIHSLVYGTPVITHNNFDCQMPEYEAIVPGRNGLFFDYGCVEDLARVIKKWLKGTRLREEISIACKEVIGTYYNPHYQVTAINEAVQYILANK